MKNEWQPCLSTCTNFDVENFDKDLKVGDYVNISKFKNNFKKSYTPNWSEKVFVIKKVENAMPKTYVMEDLIGE